MCAAERRKKLCRTGKMKNKKSEMRVTKLRGEDDTCPTSDDFTSNW